MRLLMLEMIKQVGLDAIEAEDGRGRDFSAMLPRLAARGRGAA